MPRMPCRHQTTLACRHAVAIQQAVFAPVDAGDVPVDLQPRPTLAALELKRHLGVTYKAAWRMKHKIMQAMTEREEPRKLKGFVQIDDAYLGGERSGGKRGRGSENKQPFVIAVQVDHSHEHPVFAVIEPVKAFDNASLEDWIARRLEPECEVYSDGLACFRRLEEAGHAHTHARYRRRSCCNRRPGSTRWLNVVLGNVKRAISGTYQCGGPGQVCKALPGRGGLSLQPPIRPETDAAAAGDGTAALHTLPRARFAYGKQLPWLRDGANQEKIRKASMWKRRRVISFKKMTYMARPVFTNTRGCL
ncbi:putative transposase [Xanthomonas oryzae pv. oryzae KACC 10331]|uniref:Transposase n=1 Tax=Xanthomonas oryzae pv. oryzae (strain KACC10331 / KXO85) TaxID=291331 RepID=Q5GVQ8_XANOR|nr:putative transposase [Xanthomonas oryzae pv. oryzae KACC 10331]